MTSQPGYHAIVMHKLPDIRQSDNETWSVNII